MGAEDIISLVEVSKRFRLGLFKYKTGVDNLSLSIPKGEVVGLLGPNGSGKSTTIKMILGFLAPTSGQIMVCGHSALQSEARGKIGYLPENPRFQKFLRGREIMQYYAHLLKLDRREIASRTSSLLELVGLKGAGEERVGGYSKGMTQRLAIAQTLLSRPSLLIFDEPMSGLDPLGRIEIRRLIRRIHTEMPGTTIFFSTHILADVEELCSWVALLKKGKLSTFCPLEDLLKGDSERFDLIAREIPPNLLAKFGQKATPVDTASGTMLDVSGTDTLIQLVSELRQAGSPIISISTHRKNLEQALFSEKPSPEAAA